MDALKLSNKHVVNSMFTGALAFRAYLPMFNSKIFALFAEARFTGGSGSVLYLDEFKLLY